MHISPRGPAHPQGGGLQRMDLKLPNVLMPDRPPHHTSKRGCAVLPCTPKHNIFQARKQLSAKSAFQARKAAGLQKPNKHSSVQGARLRVHRVSC